MNQTLFPLTPKLDGLNVRDELRTYFHATFARYDWPTVDEVKNYRDQVSEVVDNIILNAPLHVNVDWKSPWWAILMGIEHQRIHLETTSVLGANFRLIKGPLEIPFTFRENRRRFQHTNMEVTLWEKMT